MRQWAKVAILWCILFVLTIVGRRLFASHGNTLRQYPHVIVINMLTKARLDLQQRRGGPSDVNVPSSRDDALAAAIEAHKKSFLTCRDLIMVRSQRPKEFFEFSFEKVRSTHADGKTYARLTAIRIEKSTIGISTPDERCLVAAMGALEFEDASIRSGREFYEMCLGVRPSYGS